VVVDRNRITAGGVTAGMDFALRLAADLCGEPLARAIQLGLEYDPEPPFDSGSPDRASAELTQSVRARLEPSVREHAQRLPE
jgi:cyclohexyl-isocyanide hydratase